jgi:hypothetical protein
MSALPPWFISDPVVVSDSGYLEDYAQAVSLQGLGCKEALTAEPKCTELPEGGYLLVQPADAQVIEIDGHVFKQVLLIFDVCITKHIIGRDLPSEIFPARHSAEGCVLDDDILKFSEEEMKAEIDATNRRRSAGNGG